MRGTGLGFSDSTLVEGLSIEARERSWIRGRQHENAAEQEGNSLKGSLTVSMKVKSEV